MIVHRQRRDSFLQIARRHFEDEGVNKCEVCGWWAPRACLGKIPVLQVHHIVPVCRGGEEHPTNWTLLCPNCHRVAHSIFGGNKVPTYTDREAFLGYLKKVVANKVTQGENAQRSIEGYIR
jgi:5-methylcytosine-specific restriction endonuclease McrA